MIARPVELLVRGFDHLARNTASAYPRSRASLDLLTQLAGYGRNGPEQPGAWAETGADLASARVRRTAFAALTATRSISDELLDEALADPDAGMRVAGMRALAALTDIDRRGERAARAQQDAYFLVRLLSLDVHDRWLRDDQGCAALLRGAADENVHVASRALDLLGTAPCPQAEADAQVRMLDALTRALDDGRDWHRATHAWLSLARLGHADASPELPRFADHASPFVRTYAARGAGALGEEGVLRRLAADEDANVRAAALTGLGALVGHGADEVYVEALASEDPALVMTAAGLLEGTPDRTGAVPRLWAALARFVERGQETERDARMALMARLAELASPADSARLGPYTASFDARLAEQAALVMSRWTGRAVPATPSDPPTAPELLPTAEALARLDGSSVVLEMERGGAIRIRLAPLLAPTNAIRFAHLAESGQLDGRTVHRVVPGFVIQGGSPNANEYSGYGAYTRDEVGLGAHWRGAVGLSTRGRDTGDGQMFVNLVDNLRLDHNYTIFGQVVEGMDVVDAVLEGDVVRRASLEPSGSR